MTPDRRVALLLVALAAAGPAAAQDVRLRAIAPDDARGTAQAVVVEAGALVHTALLLPEDAGGRLDGSGDAGAQAARVLDSLQTALKAAGTSLDRLVRLHVYLTDASSTPAVERLLAGRFAGATKPAVTFVETARARDGVLVAMDAIAATGSSARPGTAARIVVPGLPRQARDGAHVAVQPSGPFVVVSGRAAQGEFDAAIAGTLEQLRADLEGVGLGFEHVVQVKSFVRDVSQASQLREIVAHAFGAPAPPQVVTEWLRAGAPAEIELIAAAPAVSAPVPADGAGVTYVEPISSRYSRVAFVHRGRPVFVSGLYGSSSDPGAQVTEMFDELRRVLTAAGSDMRHLVKATYYVSDTAADRAINDIRPTLFDAERPPAASKISVRGTGRPGKGSTFDMIAVTTER
jgi:enamine deaminase RidA (YjgF/YER057c/UK114 family)